MTEAQAKDSTVKLWGLWNNGYPFGCNIWTSTSDGNKYWFYNLGNDESTLEPGTEVHSALSFMCLVTKPRPNAFNPSEAEELYAKVPKPAEPKLTSAQLASQEIKGSCCKKKAYVYGGSATLGVIAGEADWAYGYSEHTSTTCTSKYAIYWSICFVAQLPSMSLAASKAVFDDFDDIAGNSMVTSVGWGIIVNVGFSGIFVDGNGDGWYNKHAGTAVSVEVDLDPSDVVTAGFDASVAHCTAFDLFGGLHSNPSPWSQKFQVESGGWEATFCPANPFNAEQWKDLGRDLSGIWDTDQSTEEKILRSTAAVVVHGVEVVHWIGSEIEHAVFTVIGAPFKWLLGRGVHNAQERAENAERRRLWTQHRQKMRDDEFYRAQNGPDGFNYIVRERSDGRIWYETVY